MPNPAQKQLEYMDSLSLQGKKFFFAIDFLAENIEILTEKELLQSEIHINFPEFKTQVNTSLKNSEADKLKINPTSKEKYQQGFEEIQKSIQAGNLSLINYTCKTGIESKLTLGEIYNIASAKYKILFKDQWICFSPETFIKIINNKIYTFPMKGTIDASIPNAKEILLSDNKEDAEQHAVVNLLKDYLQKISNNVHLTNFKQIDFIKTNHKNLYTTSSEISGTIKPEYEGKIGSLMQQLLPAGSILGAPREEALRLILQTEGYARGFYSGIAGWFDGKNLDSCVLIRFIEKENGKLYFKSGGGITKMSQMEKEYQEVSNKIYVPVC